MTNRDSIIEKVRKLSRMTIANGASEQEALLAAAHLERLIAEYDIAQSELTIRADAQGCLLDEFVDSSDRQTPWMTCASALSKLFSTRCYFETRQEDIFDLGFLVTVRAVKFFGFQTDVAACLAMCAIVKSAIDTESTRFARSLRESKSKPARVQSFELGMADRISDRLEEMALTQKRIRGESTGTGLIVLKDQLVTQQWAEQMRGLRLRPTQLIRVKDMGAFSAGRVVGGAVSLARSIK